MKRLKTYQLFENTQYSNSKQELILKLIINDDIKQLSDFIDNGLNINMRFNDNRTLLHKAFWQNNLNIVKLLIEKGIDLDDFCITDMLLSNDSKYDIIKYLLNNDYDIISKCPNILSELNNSPNTTQLLLDNGADVNYYDVKHDTIPIFSAVISNDIKTIKILLDNGADINKKDRKRRNLLFEVNHSTDESLVNFLIDNGADTNTLTYDFFDYLISIDLIYISLVKYSKKYELASLMSLAKDNKIDKIIILLDNGIDWFLKDSKNKYFIDYLDDDRKKQLRNLYPKKYDKFLKRKSANKFNL